MTTKKRRDEGEGYTLERTVFIAAPPALVFSFFTDESRWARWWGAGSRLDPVPGGALLIRYPNGATASGQVESLEPPHRAVFTYGYDDPEKPLAPGSTTVTVTLTPQGGGTLLHLAHARLPTEKVRDDHVPGWRFQLAMFARAATDIAHHDVARVIDRWLEAWNADDPAAVAAALEAAVTDDVRLRDAFACVEGRDELAAHIAAARRHVATSLARDGPLQQMQGAVLWLYAASRDGVVLLRGTQVMELDGDGRIRSAVAFSAAP